ncbi:MAG: hypothetical protein V2J07_00910 [Anaerolineae bacterium]|jgi:hypothetical protein|nr:hypothetical protein [Anaerolineae bacterium]
MATTCPKCGNMKGITKVSEIVKSQTDETLARRLAAPMNPQKAIKSFGARDSLVFLGLAATATTFFLALQNEAGTAIFIYGAFVLFFLVSIVRMMIIQRRTRKVADALTPGWREAALIWNRLYYCANDDVVFDPKTGETAAPADYHQVLMHYPPEIPGITTSKTRK